MAATKGRNIRIEEWLWKAVQQTAEDRHMTASEVVRRALVDYVLDIDDENRLSDQENGSDDLGTENDQENVVDHG